MDDVVSALADQQAELRGMLAGLDHRGWHAPTRCEGWDVADVVLHLAQTNEMAIASATGRFADGMVALTAGLAPTASVDDGAAAMVAKERGTPSHEILDRFVSGASQLVGLLDGMDLHTRVTWVAGELSARTLATTRIAETWIHAGDVADALGVELPPTPRLRYIARLAWRTLPYAFKSTGLTMSGPVAFELVAPDGSRWDLITDEPAATTIRGPATDLCAVAGRHVHASTTTLGGDGPDVDTVLALVRTYA